MKTFLSLIILSSSVLNSGHSPVVSKEKYAMPSSIVFNREVVQQINGEDGKKTLTYYFTINGDWAAMKPDLNSDDDQMSLMVYASDGTTLFFNDQEKTITILKMTKVIGEGVQMTKELAGQSGKGVAKSKDDLKINLTGKTKNICGYPAVEYEVKNEGGKESLYYAKVDFDPIKIYTMGAGSAGMNSKRADLLKNNPMGIPVLNKNYLLAETSSAGSGGMGMKTISITKKNTVISTAGYKVKDYSNKTIPEMIGAHSKGN